MKEVSKHYFKYAFVVFLMLLVVLSFLIIKPFLDALIIASLIVYLFYPVYKRLNKYVKNKRVASIILSIFIITLLSIPVLIMVNSLAKESVQFLGTINNLDITSFSRSISEFFGTDLQLDDYITSTVRSLISLLLTSVSNFILTIPVKILNLAIILMTIYFFFIDGESIITYLKTKLPLEKKYTDILFKKTDEIVGSILYGTFLIALLQSILALAGFLIFKISSPLILSFAVFTLALLPVVGASFIWVPLVIIKFLNNEPNMAIGLAIFFILTTTTVELFLKPKIIGDKAKVKPLIILLGAIGGLMFFGLVGLIIGPIILDLLLIFLKIYAGDKGEIKS